MSNKSFLPTKKRQQALAILLVTTLLSSCLLSSCGYSVSVNDNVVYTPAPLFDNFNISSEPLRLCVQQTIEDKKITAASQLTVLNCSNAGITNLAGLETFDALEELNLASNKIQNLEPLMLLPKLQVLILRENLVKDVAPLLRLLHLTSIDLAQNPQLDCATLHQLQTNLEVQKATITAPAQCQ